MKKLNPTGSRLKKFLIGSDILSIDEKDIADFSIDFDLIQYSQLNDIVGPESFFKGETRSFFPFVNQWHYPRREINEIAEKILNYYKKSSKVNFFGIKGNLGSGRSFVIRALITKLITQHRAISIYIPSYSNNPIPNIIDLNNFINIVNTNCDKQLIEKPNLVVFWADYDIDTSLLFRFKELSAESIIPMALIFEGFKFENDDELEELKIFDNLTSISLNDEMLEEKEELAEYIINITTKLKITTISKFETLEIIQNEKYFLAIMYKIVDPTRRSINKMIEQEYGTLSNVDTNKHLISICSIASCVNIDVPLSYLLRYLRIKEKYPLSYPELFSILDKLNVFIKYYYYNYNYYVSIFHPIVAKHLAKLIKMETMDKYLYEISDTIDIRFKNDGDFARQLLITEGINNEDFSKLCYSRDGLLKALTNLKNRQPARPIIHHLARLKMKINNQDPSIIPLLEELLVLNQMSFTLMKE